MFSVPKTEACLTAQNKCLYATESSPESTDLLRLEGATLILSAGPVSGITWGF